MNSEFQELLPILKSTACEALCSVLGVDFVPEEPWSTEHPVENPCDFGATVGFANEECRGACTLGISTEAASRLFPDLSDDLVFDAMGELGNTICGMLFGDPEFTVLHGIPAQTPPLFSRGGAWFARSFGMQGMLHSDRGQILLGFMISSGDRNRNGR